MKISVVVIVLLFVVLALGHTEDNEKKLYGGQQEVEIRDEIWQDLGLYATQERNKVSNSMFASKLVDIRNATKQVVSGMLYNITFVIQESKCDKRGKPSVEDLIDCEINNDGLKELCNAVIWEQAWMNFRELKGPVSCRPFVEPGEKVHSDEFQQFIQTYGREYTPESEEYQMRYEAFVQNMKTIEMLNRHEQGTAVYKMNQFGDLTAEEFKKFLTSGSMKPKYDPDMKEADIPQGTPPDSFDWRDHGAVTAVKNQGSCGSCWAFSTTGNIEGQWAIKKNKLVSLSEQELVDCDKIDDGCDGGLPSDAYKAIMKLGGLEDEASYPYRGTDDKCHFLPSDVKVYINGSLNISQDEQEMAAWLAENGPISIGINANAMQFYFGGIAHPWKLFCSPNNLDHGVLIVGYGVQNTLTHKNEPYWIIKNSWGSWWGESGYYRVYRGSGVCGLNKMCTSSVVN